MNRLFNILMVLSLLLCSCEEEGKPSYTPRPAVNLEVISAGFNEAEVEINSINAEKTCYIFTAKEESRDFPADEIIASGTEVTKPRVRLTDLTDNSEYHIFAAAVLLVFYLFLCIKNKSQEKRACDLSIFRHTWGFILMMAICLFMNSYFKTLAATHITATQLYPLNQGVSVILSLSMSAIFFKEKINGKCILGICLAFIALLLINFF